MSQKWFVQTPAQVEGPYSTDQVHAALKSGKLSVTHLIWGRGMDEWHKVDWWTKEVTRLTENQAQTTAPEMWHYAYQNQSHGPMARATLIHELKETSAPGDVMVWTKGMNEWAPLYEFHDLLTEIGLSRRQFPRADLSGKAILKTNGSTLSAELMTISEGGFGVELDAGLVAGQVVTVELHSPAFREIVHARAECRYTSQGVVGLKFTHLSSEHKGAIIQYVRQSQTRFNLKAA